MEISYGLVNLMYFMLCGELNRIKGSRSNKRRKLLTCFTNSLSKVYNNLSLRETGPEVYNISTLLRFFTPGFTVHIYFDSLSSLMSMGCYTTLSFAPFVVILLKCFTFSLNTWRSVTSYILYKQI